MQFKSLFIKEHFRDVVGSISLEELMANHRLLKMIIIVEALFQVELKELRL